MRNAFIGLMFGGILIFAGGAFAHDSNCEDGLKPKAAQKWTGKFLVFDTNVILNDPQAIYKYPGAQIIISGTVIEEIDGKKNDPRLGRTARVFSREIMKLIEKNHKTTGIALGAGSILNLDYADYMSQLSGKTLDKEKKDNELIALAMEYGQKHGSENVVLISDDTNVRIKSYGLNVRALPFELDLITPTTRDADQDIHVFEISDRDMQAFLNDKVLPVPGGLKIQPNEFVSFSSRSTPASEATVGRFHFDRENPDHLEIRALPDFKALPFQPKNLEQAMALDVLLDPTVDIVFLEAKAGTGKTFITLMAALQALAKKTYSRVLLSKPTVYMGHNNPGALPGDIKEKYAEWMRPYLDNLTTLMREGNRSGMDRQVTDLPSNFELLTFEFMRGRSIPRAMIVVDEFQNTSLLEAKTILTRAGEKSKMVLMGDASQIDVSPNFLNATNNGLSVSAALFTNPDLPMASRSRVARVHLRSGVRSALAELATEVFDKPIPLD